MVRVVDRLTAIAVGVFLLVVVTVASLFAWLVANTLELRDENDEVNQVTRQLLVDFADEVERSLITDCELGNDRSEGIIRFWDDFVAFFSGPDTTPEAAARAAAFRDKLVASFPVEDCDRPPLIGQDG